MAFPLAVGVSRWEFGPTEADGFSLIKPALVLHVLHFIGYFFYKTRPSLARAAFKRDFLYNQKGNLLDKGVA